jgi:hypothetical protein
MTMIDTRLEHRAKENAAPSRLQQIMSPPWLSRYITEPLLCAWHVTMRTVFFCYTNCSVLRYRRYCVVNLRERNRLGGPGVDGRIIFRWIFRIWGMGWIELA